MFTFLIIRWLLIKKFFFKKGSISHPVYTQWDVSEVMERGHCDDVPSMVHK